MSIRFRLEEWCGDFIHVILLYIGVSLLPLIWLVSTRERHRKSKSASFRFDSKPIGSPAPAASSPSSLRKTTQQISSSVVGAVLRDFLRDLRFPLQKPAPLANSQLEDDVRSYINSFSFPPRMSGTLLKLVPLCAASTDIVYPLHPPKLKLYITIFTVFFLYIDDLASSSPADILLDLRLFSLKAMTRSEELTFFNPAVKQYISHLYNETPKWFGPYFAGIIYKSVVDAMLGAQLEAEFPEGIQTGNESVRLSRFLRAKTGNSEAYAAFLFPTSLYPESTTSEQLLPISPDMVELIDSINDIMPFYKESVVGHEQNTYIMNSARALSCSPIVILQKTCERQKELISDMRACLAVNQAALEDFERFGGEYLTWHIAMGRYRLKEAGLEFGSKL